MLRNHPYERAPVSSRPRRLERTQKSLTFSAPQPLRSGESMTAVVSKANDDITMLESKANYGRWQGGKGWGNGELRWFEPTVESAPCS